MAAAHAEQSLASGFGAGLPLVIDVGTSGNAIAGAVSSLLVVIVAVGAAFAGDELDVRGERDGAVRRG
jgi:hypothetical protein